MRFTEILRSIFVRQPKAAVNNADTKGMRRFLSKISGAFMLPISIMAIAGLFLGVGAAFEAHTSAVTFGTFIKNLGDPVFGAMPLLFMAAIIIAFTDDIGTALFSGIIALLVFNAIQNPFMEVSGDGTVGKAYFLNIHTSDAIASRVYKIAGSNLGIASMNTSIFGGIIVGFIVAYLYKKFYMIELPTYISFFGGKRFVPFIAIIAMIPLAFIFLLIWPWIGLGLAYFGEYSGKVMGLDSFIFGYVERSLIPFGLHHVFYAPLWWTSAGGSVSTTVTDFNGVINAINDGDINQQTVALSHLNQFVTAFNTHAQAATDFTAVDVLGLELNSLSGFTYNPTTHMLSSTFTVDTINEATITTINNDVINLYANTGTNKKLFIDLANELQKNPVKWDQDLKSVLLDKIGPNANGDSFGWLAVNGSGVYSVTFTNQGETASQTLPIFDFISKQGLRLGRFMQGKFAFMQLGLPAAGVAMILAAPRENRKLAASIIVPASLTSFVTGVTEPIEFTFLFLAPWLFWGFHAFMAALSFLFMNLFGAHVGMTFSGGFIDMIIYGAIPVASGTHFWWMYVIGVVYAPIYFFFFYWAVKRFDLATPGRGAVKKLFTKKDYLAKKDRLKAGNKSALSPQGAAIVKAYGGWSNIVKFNNCASRLRYDVKDAKKVDEKALKAAGVAGIMRQGKNHVQAIVGTKAESLNTNIKANKGSKL